MIKKLYLVEKSPAGLVSLSSELRTGKRALLDYLTRLESLYDEREPRIHAFVTESQNPFERLRGDLEQLIMLFPDPVARPALFGIPVGIKDIIHVEGYPTRAGSRLPPEVIAGHEAAVVKKLKSAGALIMGKTVTAEFAMGASAPTCNPYNTDHAAGGSSSGSAAAVATGLCPLALGTQTIGSVIRPAAYCGIVGVKPTYGRIPIDGMVPVSKFLDHVGFFTTDIDGAELAASILVDGWRPVAESDSFICGVPEGPYLERTTEEGLDHFYQTCGSLEKAGINIKHITTFDNFDGTEACHYKLCEAEMAVVHRDWFRKYSNLYSEDNRQAILRGQKVGAHTLKRCRVRCEALKNELRNIVEQHNLSAFLAPAATGPAPKGLESTGDCVMNLPWTQAGLPVITLPSGLSKNGLPMGLQMIGRWMEDERLFNLARHLTGLLKWPGN
jgi:Asp-tRNA(Asn)/Glu-tRNA(Gln) amidotransferase A subunit family amidase